jgi:ferritin-like protein
MPTSVGLHEDAKLLRPETVDRHRAVASLGEELEAIDWYDQRVDATQDEELKKILAHNRDEEKEHAAMTLEWLRRHDPKIDQVLSTYLFTEGSVVGIEGTDTGGNGGAAAPGDGSLGIGSLKR